MKTLARIATAFAAGAALMYYLDPQGGRRRRARVRDHGMSATREAQRALRGQSHRIADQARGVFAKARAAIAPAPVSDDQLHDRIRARLGHLIAHPGQVNVDVQRGYVVLRGHASIEEIEELTTRLPSMHGVTGVDNRMSPLNGHARP